METSNTQRPLGTSKSRSQDSPSEDGAKKENGNPQSPGDTSPLSKKPGVLRRIWTASGLDTTTLKLMFKGAAAPTIAIAIYQATAIAEIYVTVEYLVAIMSILSMPIMPRSKFIQTMFLNIVGVCLGACIALLAVYSSVQARKHTTPVITSTSTGAPTSGTKVSGYNSSASAVSAIWLFFNIWLVNTLRASRPQLQLPVIMISIFAMISSTYAPIFPTMASGISFVKRLLEAFTLGFAIATGVNFVIFPMTCRGIFFKRAAGMIGILQGTLVAQKDYVQSLEKEDMFDNATTSPNDLSNKDGNAGDDHPHLIHSKRPKAKGNPHIAKLKGMVDAMGALQGAMYADISFAKCEAAYGKLDASDIAEIHHHIRDIMLPLYGMNSIADIFGRVAEKRGWVDRDESAPLTNEDPKAEMRNAKVKQWNEIMKTLHEPFETMTGAMCDGLQHVSYALELAKPPSAVKKTQIAKSDSEDVEADAGSIKPGDPKFSNHMKEKMDGFYAQRQTTLNSFMKKTGVYGDEDDLSGPAETLETVRRMSLAGGEQSEAHKRNQRQLYMVLYMEFLLWSIGKAVLRFIVYVDRRVDEGVMKKNRLILPGNRRTIKWFKSIWKKQDMGSSEQNPDSSESGSAGVYSGASFETGLDPEHLPPANAWQRGTNVLRTISRTLGSMESSFGFRVACATLTIGILAFLKNTQVFFTQQRLVWAMIMVAIGMTTTAGAGIFGFVGRILGTTVAMCTSLVIWYIVDGHTPGVIVFLFVFTFIEFYFLIKFPKIMIISLLSMVTQVLIIGYELQVTKLGIKASISTGQPYYNIHLLAPYRLATVAGGMLVAFIWTFFPYPLTERSQLRKDLGASLYLLANFYSVVHTSVGVRIKGKEGDVTSKESPGRKLEKARRSIWDKEMALIAGLRQHSAFTSWEPTFGGRFPKETYDAIITKVSNLVKYLSLISFASETFSHDPTKESADGDDAQWINDFARLVGGINPTSQEITSTLALLSASVTNGTPLPPYLKTPDPYQLSARLQALDKDILSLNHVLEPGYSAFAVMQIASSLVKDDMTELIEHVKKLVGEVDFSFHVHSSAASSDATLYNGVKGKTE